MELYKGQAGSPVTNLASAITATQTTITVNDGIALPDAPNIATIWSGTDFETFRYGAKTGNTLSDITRGVEGSPMVWAAGTEVARFYTAYDHQAIIDTIEANKQEVTTHQAESASRHIKESGTNSNGSYIKFDDGTMICSRIATLDYIDGYTLGANRAFAATFISTPTVFGNLVDKTSTVHEAAFSGVRMKTITTTHVLIHLYRVVSTTTSLSLGDTATVNILAIGRWK